MRLVSVLFFVAAVLFAPARAGERDIVRTFPARSGCALTIDTFRGAITVTETDAAEIRVAVHIAIGADDAREEQRLVEALQLDISASGGTVHVTARDPQQSGPRFVWDDKKQLEPTYRVTVPKRCDVSARTRIGPITIGNIEGTITARTEGGDVFFRHIRGPAEAYTATGDVVISHCDGPLRATTKLGGIRVGTVTGRCELTDMSGDIEVQSPHSDLWLYAEAGTASITFPRDYAGNAQVRTSGGPIIAAIDPKASCEIDASASLFAHVNTRLPLEVRSGKAGSRHLVAVQNAGAAHIQLRASGGDVTIQRGRTVFEDTAEPAPQTADDSSAKVAAPN